MGSSSQRVVRTSTLCALLVSLAALGSACGEDRTAAGSGGVGGYGGVGGVGGVGATGGYGGASGVGAGAGGEFGGAAGTGSVGGSAGVGGNAGIGGSSGTGDAGADASVDGGTEKPCPATFECVTDPLFKLLSACMPVGGMSLPPACMTDADCPPAGLPEALCLMEEETGLNGCVQICTP